MMKCTKYHPDVSITRRVHLAEQKGVPQKMHLRIRLRAHMSAYQRKLSRRTCTWGSADPQVQVQLDEE